MNSAFDFILTGITKYIVTYVCVTNICASTARTDSIHAFQKSVLPTLTPPTRPEEDILFQWRLRRKLEQARESSSLHGSTFSWQAPRLSHPPASGLEVGIKIDFMLFLNLQDSKCCSFVCLICSNKQQPVNLQSGHTQMIIHKPTNKSHQLSLPMLSPAPQHPSPLAVSRPTCTYFVMFFHAPFRLLISKRHKAFHKSYRSLTTKLPIKQSRSLKAQLFVWERT